MRQRRTRRIPPSRPIDGPGPYRALARSLDLTFLEEASVRLLSADARIPAESAALAAAIRSGHLARVGGGGESLALVAPRPGDVDGLRRHLAEQPSLRSRIMLTTPRAIRGLLLDAGAELLAEEAASRLALTAPEHSAGRRMTTAQAIVLVLAALLLAGLFLHSPLTALVGLNIIGGGLFFAVSILRLIAAQFATTHRARSREAIRTPDADLPVYSILVPLLDEAHVVPTLIAGLGAIDWPRDRLDIKFLVEAHDESTRRALEEHARSAEYEILTVPPIGPRTKPKALSFALPLCRGDLVAVYDAEDQPDPGQLREAHAAFVAGGPKLGCVQAPLVAHPRHGRFVERLFALEYATLFDGLLPLLAHFDMPLPLGGTSNHFRRIVLDEIGGWDPYNMTEDADLGVRLKRFGYSAATIRLPTHEETPPSTPVWLKQRTRWFKGWLQTLLVHTRHPRRLARELGLAGSIGFVLMVAGMTVSAAIHPVWLVTLVTALLAPLSLWGDGGLAASAILGLNLFNLAAGYVAYVWLGIVALKARGRRPDIPTLALVPVYWLMMSLATYRALLQLVTEPYRWEKTPHGMPAGKRRRLRAPRQAASSVA